MLKLKETPENLHQRTYGWRWGQTETGLIILGKVKEGLQVQNSSPLPHHTHTPCSKHTHTHTHTLQQTHTHTIVRSFYGFLKEHCIFPCLYFPRKSGELKLSKPGQEMNQNTVIMHICYSQSFSRGRYRDRYKMGSYKRSHFYYKMVYLKTCNYSVAKSIDEAYTWFSHLKSRTFHGNTNNGSLI
jgi:hypothetical protein